MSQRRAWPVSPWACPRVADAPSLALRVRRARRRLTFVTFRGVLRLIGFDAVAPFGRFLGSVQFHLAWRERRRIQHDIAQWLGRDEAQVEPLLAEAYRINNAAVLEIMSMFDRPLGEAQVEAHCRVDGLEHLREALSQGRGAILLAAHMGNAAMLPVRLVNAGWSVSVVYREARMMTAGFFQEGLARYGIQGILANAGIKAYGQMLSALKQGRVVFVMMDQGVKKADDGQPHRFLGKTMPMPAGPAQLARAARAPVLPVFTLGADPVWHLAIQPPVALELVSVEADVQALLEITEQQIRSQPSLWSWHHRRWRSFPLSAAS
ncbi:lipid A biosynthesis lauroyl acyltransferase [soil metagenome]